MPKIIIILFFLLFSNLAIAQEHKLLNCANAGYSVCQLDIGKSYAFGEGINKDYDQALYWLKQKPIENGNIQAIDLVYAIEQFRKNGDQSLLEEIELENIEVLPNADTVKNDSLSSDEVNKRIDDFKATGDFSPEFVDLLVNHNAELEHLKENSKQVNTVTTDDYSDLSGNDLIAKSIIEKQYGLLSIYLIFSFILTWTIGLTPPLLIRYVFYKRPFNQWPAVGVCAIFAVLNISIFSYLGSQSHSALALISIFSYLIIRRGYQKTNYLSTATVNKKVDN